MKSFYRYLIPSVIASIFMSAYAIVDGMFIGGKLHDTGLSAINLAWPITSFLQAIGTSIGISGGIYISKLNALDDESKSNKISLTTILIILFFSIILGFVLFVLSKNILILFGAKGTTLEYANDYLRIIIIGATFQMLGSGLIPLLKNKKRVKMAMAASLTSIFVNFILDYIFIYIFSWDLKGAALASVIAQVTSFFVCIIPFAKKFGGVTRDISDYKTIFLGALAPFVLNYSYAVIIIITNSLCLKCGNDEAVAAYTLLSYLLYVVCATSQGVADAIQPLFSYHYTKKEYRICHKMLYKCFIISFLLILVFVIIFYLLRHQLEKLYGLSINASGYYEFGLYFYMIGFLLVSFFKVYCSYFYSIDNKKIANFLTILEPIVVTPLIYLIVCPFLKLNGIWISFLIIQALMLIISICFYIAVLKKEKN